jgi:hypothetical protein
LIVDSPSIAAEVEQLGLAQRKELLRKWLRETRKEGDAEVRQAHQRDRRRRGLPWNEPQAPDGSFAGDARDPATRAAVVAALDDVNR